MRLCSAKKISRQMENAPKSFFNFSGGKIKRDNLYINLRFLLHLQQFQEEKNWTKIWQKKTNEKQNQRRETTRHVTKRKQTASFVVVVNRIHLSFPQSWVRENSVVVNFENNLVDQIQKQTLKKIIKKKITRKLNWPSPDYNN